MEWSAASSISGTAFSAELPALRAHSDGAYSCADATGGLPDAAADAGCRCDPGGDAGRANSIPGGDAGGGTCGTSRDGHRWVGAG
jgi:hypothetical protein